MSAVGQGRAWVLGLVALGVVAGACTENVPRGGTFRPSSAPLPPHPAGVGDESMVWPVGGAIVSPFRPWTRPNHQGVDLAAPPGTPVVAAKEGRASFVGRIPGYGNVVAIEHDRQMTTVYSHLADDLLVREGTAVATAETIGQIDETGYLHFEIRRRKSAVDPSAFYTRPPKPGSPLAEPGADVPSEPAEAVPLGRRDPVAAGRIAEEPRAGLEVEDLGAATPTAAPTRMPAAAPTRTPTPRPTATPTSTPEPTPTPTFAAPSRRSDPGALGERTIDEESPGATPAPADTEAFADEDGGGGDASTTAGLLVANLFYVPAKLAYAGIGGVVGGFAYALTGGAVTDVWDSALGGDFFLDAEHLRGERPIRFAGDPAP